MSEQDRWSLPDESHDRAFLDLWIQDFGACAWSAADEVGVFVALAEGPRPHDDLADLLRVEPVPLLALCRALVALGALETDGSTFWLTRLSRSFWVKTSPLYRGREFDRHRDWEQHQRIVDALDEGWAPLPADETSFSEAWRDGNLSPETAESFTRVMHSTITAPALAAVRSGAFHGVRHFVDVGGGSGVFAALLADHQLGTTATVMDLPSVCDASRKILRQAPGGDRVGYFPGNFFVDPWPTDADAFGLSNVLHDWPRDACRTILRSVFEALAAGGRVFVHELLLDDDRCGPRTTALFNLLMCMNHRGQQFTRGDLFDLLDEAGFRDPRVVPVFVLVSGGSDAGSRCRGMMRASMDLLPYEDRLHLPEHLRTPRPNPDRSEYVLKTMRKIQLGEKKQSFASWTMALGDEGLTLFNARPSSQWWVRDYDLEPILSRWGLRALDGFVACGAGAPAQTVPVARYIESPRVAPMMAEALGRLTKQRALAETWLMSYPRAAAIGLVPQAVGKRKKPREFALGALEHLVRGGHGAVVGEIAAAYGASKQLTAVLEVPVTAPAERTLDLDQHIRELEEHLLLTNASSEAYRFVDELCGMDADRALFAVVEISRRARSKPVRRRAAQALDAVRARRGLSPSDLEDRMLPDLGLGEDTVEIGGTVYRLAAGTSLDRQIVDASGKRTTRLPRGASAEVKAKWSLLGKELRTVSRAVISRLEVRMITAEPWPADVFRRHVVGHPVLRELARGLLFGAGNLLFRVAEDYTLANVDEHEVTLPDAPVTIVHPLDLTREQVLAWAEVFSDNEVTQPFDQLGRWHGTGEVDDGKLVGWAGRSVSPFALLALERRGWQRSRIESGAVLMELTRSLCSAHATVAFGPGIELSDIPNAPPQALSQAWIHGEPTPRVLSEILRDLHGLER